MIKGKYQQQGCKSFIIISLLLSTLKCFLLINGKKANIIKEKAISRNSITFLIISRECDLLRSIRRYCNIAKALSNNIRYYSAFCNQKLQSYRCLKILNNFTTYWFNTNKKYLKQRLFTFWDEFPRFRVKYSLLQFV